MYDNKCGFSSILLICLNNKKVNKNKSIPACIYFTYHLHLHCASMNKYMPTLNVHDKSPVQISIPCYTFVP